MSGQSNRIASQLKDFIESGYVYADELDDELIERIRGAADKVPEETVPFGVSKHKGKARRTIFPRFPPE
ncbi:hypothetical protein K3495_g79 [Podosphaera aphanis]|nr:hypothetical protein K3495_g79 [Podosphaera aphanis]